MLDANTDRLNHHVVDNEHARGINTPETTQTRQTIATFKDNQTSTQLQQCKNAQQPRKGKTNEIHPHQQRTGQY